MTSKNNPPRLAVWLLRLFGAGDGEALTGDLVEQWGEGRPGAWFWRPESGAVGRPSFMRLQRAFRRCFSFPDCGTR
jgi:hypothetical protein